jgi:RNA polymerase sigma-70 factor (ECF subfamily)
MASSLTTARRDAGPSMIADEVPIRQLGDADFRAFYVARVDFVRRVVARLLGPGHDVDDAVQEVFLVAWRKRAGFEGRARLSTWLYAIARRVVMATRRRARVRRLLGLEVAPATDTAPSPQQLFEHREASQRLYAMLERISDKKRTVFILHEVEGLPGEDIARIVGCPLKTVWTRLHHARRELQALAATLDGSCRP